MSVHRANPRFLVLAIAIAALPAMAALARTGGIGPLPRSGEEFFVMSSIDAGHHRIVLKRPNDVTLLMKVSERTVYRNEQGKALRLTDLRAGDTVFVTFAHDASGELAAQLVRQGPMTVPELQRRYLRPAPPS
ncbi:MAG TPA: hypothetical protein VHR45_06470 [Thermoanaerobaculia bacterium]|nr:hypothetical protein [Thermoanaerobaculia bacterium]